MSVYIEVCMDDHKMAAEVRYNRYACHKTSLQAGISRGCKAVCIPSFEP